MKPMRPTHIIACLIWLASPLAAQQRHTITHEDVFLMKRVGSPAISPDGRWIVFSVTEPSYTEAEQVSDLWLVPTDGSAEPRRLTNSKGGEGGVDWSPDSRRIAFTARREGDDQAQVYVLDLASGGEAQRITSLSTGASSGGRICSRRRSSLARKRKICWPDASSCKVRDSAGSSARAARISRPRGRRTAAASCSRPRQTAQTGHTEM